MNEKKIIVDRSPVAETLGYLCLLANNIDGELPTELKESLNFFINNKVAMEEIGNLFLEIDCLLPTRDFIQALRAMEENKFIYYILGERIPIATIQEKKLEEIKDSSLREYTVFCMDNYKKFREHFIKLLEEAPKILEVSKDDSYEKKHQEFESYVNYQLTQLAPLDIAQELMGKQFHRISNYKKYIFISTAYNSTPCIRYFDSDTLIVLKNINPMKEKLTAEHLIKFTKILSDKTRLNILKYIAKKPSFGIELSEHFKVSRPTISHHLDTFNKIGLVNIERDKNTKYYSLNKITYKRYLKELNDFVVDN